jgi:hypothetical protein
MGDAGDEIIDRVMDEADKSRLNSRVAIAVSIIATLMALGKVKDDNICQGIAKCQAGQIDQWSYFQAKSTKENIAQATLDQLKVLRDTAPGVNRAQVDAKIAVYESDVAKYEKEKSVIKAEADALNEQQGRLESRDDQFDLSDAALSIALALMALTALTQKKWLLYVGLTFAVVGLVYTIAGFMSWNLSPGFVSRLLG